MLKKFTYALATGTTAPEDASNLFPNEPVDEMNKRVIELELH